MRLRSFGLVLPLMAGMALGLGVAVLLIEVTRNSHAAQPPQTSAPTAEAAVALYVRSIGETYAGLCEQTRSPQDIGKVCARYIDQRGPVQAYLIGRTFSEFSTWVFVAQTTNGWTVIATEPLDFHAPSLVIPWPP